MRNNTELVFVYNADSGIFSSIKDSIHKSISPKTYGCNLCGLTYGKLSMKDEWKTFIKGLTFKTEFLHKDEFKKKYPKYAMTFYPAVFKKEGAQLFPFISADEINKQKSLEELKQLIQNKIQTLQAII
ncbi:hypothetical protein COY16_02980 [Candidatus Roizmanbacteria bacterium CG_4_10_14_0_2_um_filter_39_13]|uniref:GTPase n=1 Tax=Candidatus Roizmanbacteria bacterium CG_4_10_14_0_2_um_filter_39_13 TaxID=1974825 RepID=A0A2M7TZ13_9BACT|nr:MAG: hypothetical protein COY16_02980 [Candidatus Roizmanbacteria bacterium CG_4_10_14_0_2_um_filter_39_13]